MRKAFFDFLKKICYNIFRKRKIKFLKTPFLKWWKMRAARFGTKRAEFSIIPPAAKFVKQKMQKNCTRSDPGIC